MSLKIYHYFRCILIAIFLLNFGLLQSQTDNYNVKQEYSDVEIENGGNLKSPPIDFSNPEIFYSNPYAYIDLWIDGDSPPYVSYEFELSLEITPILPNGDSDINSISTEIIKVEFSNQLNSANYANRKRIKIKNRYGVSASVVSFNFINSSNNVSSTTDAPSNIHLDLGFSSEYFQTLSNQEPVVNSTINSINNENGESIETNLDISWDTIPGAESYDVEWAWIDNYNIDLGTILPAAEIEFSEGDFEHNHTRITTSNQSFSIPLIFASGYLIYRVRPVGRLNVNSKVKRYGSWSTGKGDKLFVAEWGETNYIKTTPHEANKNWQFQASYAEDGKKKEVVSYFDGTLRNRQTVTTINSDNNAIVGETVYDNQGRPGIEILPVPSGKQDLRFYPDFNRSLNDIAYSHLDFDWDSPNVLDCEIDLTGMSNSTGSSKYYSPNNSTLNNFQDWVPDALNYPFSQIEYTPDNTGRIRRKGGVGSTHQLGSGHEMKYYYTKPEQKELDRLFGYNVGISNHYKKNMVVDPNGQVSVSYIDPQGRTIATALTGDSPNNLEGLTNEDNSSGLHELITLDLLNKQDPTNNGNNNEYFSTGQNGILKDGIKLTKELGVSLNSVDYNFQYSVSENISFIPEFCPENQYPFVYDLEISLTNDCGVNLLNPEINSLAGTESLAGNHIPVNTPAGTGQFEATLDVGSYTLNKNLTVNNEVLDNYANDYLEKLQNPSSNCYIDPEQFNPDPSFGGCFETCEECYISLGEMDIYVLDKLIAKYLNSTFTLTGEDQDGYPTVSFTNLPDDINGLEVIDLDHLDIYLVTYSEEWKELLAGCDALCSPYLPSTFCETVKDKLLYDLLPGGQYATVTLDTLLDASNNPILDNNGDYIITVLDPLSIFNEVSVFGRKNSSENIVSWKNPPSDYLDSDGERYRVRLSENNGEYNPLPAENVSVLSSEDGTYKYIYPEQLKNVKDFINIFQDPWAELFLSHHPEYYYLEYVISVCDRVSSGSEKNSYDFDNDLENINTYQDANALNFTSSIEQIYNVDPYFPVANANGTLEQIASYIMQKSIDQKYESQYADMSLVDLAYRMTVCNGLTECSEGFFSISSLSEEQKTQYWQQSKSLYLSLKKRLQSIVMNINAYENGYYNGCIGEVSNSIFSIIKNPDYRVLFENYVENLNVTQFCDSEFANLYSEKTKVFLPTDAFYDSSKDEEDLANELATDGDYILYSETGSCPLAFKMESFIKGLVTQKDGAGIVKPILGNYEFTEGFFARDLFKAIGGSIGSPSPLTFNISGSSTLNLQIPNIAACSNILSLNLPQTIDWNGSNTWNNYGGVTGWKILEIKNFYYDKVASGDGIYAFQVLGDVLLGNGEVSQFVFTGTTCAAIGDCGTSSNVEGQVISNQVSDPNSEYGCTIRAKFNRDYVILLNKLKNLGELDNTSGYSLANLDEYKSSYLPEFLGDDPNNLGAVWVYDGIKSYNIQNVQNLVQFSPDKSINEISIDKIESLYFYAEGESISGFDLKINFSSNSGGLTGSIEADFNSDLSFACCEEEVVRDNIIHFSVAYNSVAGYLTNEGRLNVADGLKVFRNSNLNSDLYITTIDHASDIARLSSREEFANYVWPDPFVNSSNEINVVYNSALKLRIQDNNYYRPFSRMTTSLNQSNYSTFDIAFFVFTNSNFTDSDLVNNQQLYQTLLQTKADKVFFILREDGNPYYNATTGTWNSAEYYISNIIGSSPVNYDSTGSILDSDYIVYSKSEFESFGFKDQLAALFQQGYDEAKSMTGSTTQPKDCLTCIPQQVPPIAAPAKFQQYLSFMNFDSSGQSQRINGYLNNESFYSQDMFRDMNLQYLVDSYIYYITSLNITTVEDPLFLDLVDFGNTNLNYGFLYIQDAIDDFNAYAQVNDPTDEDFKNWGQFVNEDFSASLPQGICPPKPMPFTINPANLPLNENPVGSCQEFNFTVNATYQDELYQSYLQRKVEDFRRNYIKEGLENVVETFEMSYFDKEYQYTLYYYDQAGNLAQTVAPQGVDRLDVSNQSRFDAINQHRNSATPSSSVIENNSINPTHSFETSYKYNSLNQLVWQNTPDGGTTRFAYDKLGRIVLSQNSKQLSTNTNKTKYAASYTKYDGLGRIVEAGTITTTALINNKGDVEGFDLNDPTFPENLVSTDGNLPNYSEVTKTVYDTEVIVEYDEGNLPVYTKTLFITSFDKYNLRNRVAGVLYYDKMNNSSNLAQFDNALFYNYDVHGNVKEQVVYINSLKQDCSILGTDCEAHIRRIAYEYDLISGNVKKVIFQPNYKGYARKPDFFAHRYFYDADNRIISAETSKDGEFWEKDASYKYYAHGPLARVELGDKKVQGLDYIYNLQGWLKSVNGEDIQTIQKDFGKDGLANSNYGNIGRDAFGYTLNYFTGDYQARLGSNGGQNPIELQISSTDPAGQNPANLYNGNIKAMFTGLTSNTNQRLATLSNAYSYDQLNRIKSMNSFQIGSNNQEMYSAQYSYDQNGNLKTLNRDAPQFGTNGSYNGIATIDAFNYNYSSGTNKLQLVADSGQNILQEDLKDQISALAGIGISYNPSNVSTHNYIYDEIGQLVEDKTEGLKINWRTDGKIDNILKMKKVKSKGKTIFSTNGAQTIDFEYDGMGNRIAKAVLRPEQNEKDYTFYGRDAQGNVLGVYTGTNILNAVPLVEVNEHYIYGSSRLGMDVPDGSTYAYTPPRKPGNGFGRSNFYLPFDNSTDHSIISNGNLSFTWPGSFYSYDSPESLPMSRIFVNTRIKVNDLPTGTGYIGKLQHYQENERIPDSKEYTLEFYLKNNGSGSYAFQVVLTRLKEALIPGPSIEYTSRVQTYTTPYQFDDVFLTDLLGFDLTFNFQDDAGLCQDVSLKIGEETFNAGTSLTCNIENNNISPFSKTAEEIKKTNTNFIFKSFIKNYYLKILFS